MVTEVYGSQIQTVYETKFISEAFVFLGSAAIAGRSRYETDVQAIGFGSGLDVD